MSNIIRGVEVHRNLTLFFKKYSSTYFNPIFSCVFLVLYFWIIENVIHFNNFKALHSPKWICISPWFFSAVIRGLHIFSIECSTCYAPCQILNSRSEKYPKDYHLGFWWAATHYGCQGNVAKLRQSYISQVL